MNKTLVIIPTYNEIENIENIIAAINEATDLDILVVDGNSPDETAKKVESLKKINKNLHLIKKEKKEGLGKAYVLGFQFAQDNKYENIIQMDADFSHNPAIIPMFLDKIKNYDVVVGTRYMKGGSVRNWSFWRILLSFSASIYVRLITGLPLKDPTSGFKCIRVEVLKKTDFKNIKSSGYSFQIESAYKLWKSRARFAEIPITFEDRQHGKTKMSKAIVWEAVCLVWKLKNK
jgi:dolichol-phosphate mannosyltransferase